MSLWKGKRAQDPGLDLRQIESLLKTSLTLDPKFAEAHFQLGNFYSDQNQYADAIPEYLKALVNSIRILLMPITGWDRHMSVLGRKIGHRQSLRSIRRCGSSTWPIWTNNGRKSGSSYIQRRRREVRP